jgi:hypothetical protein
MVSLLQPAAGAFAPEPAKDDPRIVPLPELMKPDSVLVDGGNIFFTDQATIVIYSLKDFKHLKTFGKSGEGPQEFKVALAANLGLRVSLPPGKILVNSIAKVSFLDRGGTYLTEHKLTSNIQDFKPLGKKYAGYGQLRENDVFILTINLYDDVFKLEKEIYRKDWYAQTVKEFNPIYMAFGITRRALYHTYKGRLFVEGANGEILAFDGEGKKLFSINHDYGKVPFTDTHKKEILKKYDRAPRIKQMVEKKGVFPAYFPPRYFTVADGKVYVLTFKKEDGKSQFYIFDTNGKFLKKVMLPFEEMDVLLFYPYTIAGGTLYQLIEDEDEEGWQLRITPM